MSKILSNRLKPLLPKLIGLSQSAFLAGRQILDGALILNEIVDELKSKKKPGFIFKADFSKAFDCVSWSYLDQILECMGFGNKWRSWISSCLKSASISILVNGSPTGTFSTTRGLRQGDPLSPFLFIIAAEGFNMLMKVASSLNLFSGIKIGCNNLEITHLQYADDTIIAGDYSWDNVIAIKFILRWYEMVSGLEINYKKSKLISVNIPSEWGSSAASKLCCKTESLPFTYLGLPVGSSPHSYSFWKPVINKIESRLSSWKRKLLSAGGRVTLVTSVLSALPLFYSSLFKFPGLVLKKISKILRSFFWGGSNESTKIKWVAWNKVCFDREGGGLGLPNMQHRNTALLAKWAWRFGQEDSSLWKQVILAKYYNGIQQFNIQNVSSNRFSKLWADILSIGDTSLNSANGSSFKHLFHWSIGNGAGTRFWSDKWMSNTPLRVLCPRIFALSEVKEAFISDFVIHYDGNTSWDLCLSRQPRGRALSELSYLLNRLNSFHIDPSKSDTLLWLADSSHHFTVSSAYQVLCKGDHVLEPSLIKVIWQKFLPLRVSVFAWKVAHNGIASKDNLLHRGIVLQNQNFSCQICNNELETSNHLFLFCPQTTKLWFKIQQWWGTSFPLPRSIQELMLQSQALTTVRAFNSLLQLVIVTSIWAIWFFRNNLVFRAKPWCVEEVFHFVQSRTFIWIKSKIQEAHFTFSDWVQFPLIIATSL